MRLAPLTVCWNFHVGTTYFFLIHFQRSKKRRLSHGHSIFKTELGRWEQQHHSDRIKPGTRDATPSIVMISNLRITVSTRHTSSFYLAPGCSPSSIPCDSGKSLFTVLLHLMSISAYIVIFSGTSRGNLSLQLRCP